jgi:hypothetical protein
MSDGDSRCPNPPQRENRSQSRGLSLVQPHATEADGLGSRGDSDAALQSEDRRELHLLDPDFSDRLREVAERCNL